MRLPQPSLPKRCRVEVACRLLQRPSDWTALACPKAAGRDRQLRSNPEVRARCLVTDHRYARTTSNPAQFGHYLPVTGLKNVLTLADHQTAR
jgi:hypothetical protein